MHFVAENDVEAAAHLPPPALVPALQQHGRPAAHRTGRRAALYDPELNELVPRRAKIGYDVRDVIARLVDRADFLEVQSEFARNIVVGFGRVRGANRRPGRQPALGAGRRAGYRRLGQGRGLRPLLQRLQYPARSRLVDIPGFLPGVDQEYGGIIRHGAKLLFAYSAATVPKITVVLRKAYGGGYIAMCAKDLGADCVIAWPSAEIAVMGAEAAVEIVFRRELAEAADPAGTRAGTDPGVPGNVLHARTRRPGCGLVDDIIEPAQTRGYIADALDALFTKRDWRPQKKHGLTPL